MLTDADARCRLPGFCARESRRRRRLSLAVDRDEHATLEVVRVDSGLVEIKYRCKTDIGAFKQGGPFIAGLARHSCGHPRLQGRPVLARVLAQRIDLIQAQSAQQFGIKLRLDRAQADRLAIGTGKNLVEGRTVEEEILGRVVLPITDAAHLVHQPRQGRYAVDHRRVDHLTQTRAARFMDCAHQPEEQKHRAAAHIANQRRRQHRQLTRPAGGRERAGQRHIVDVMSGRLRQWAGLAPTGDAAENQFRVAGGHGGGAETQALHHAGAKAFDQGVSRFKQLPDQSLAIR